jgi:hypothetical protein
MHRNLSSNKKIGKSLHKFPILFLSLKLAKDVQPEIIIFTESMRDIPWQQHWSPIWSGIHDVCSHSIIKSHLTEGYISAYGRKSSKLYKYVARLELPSVPIRFLDHCKNVTIVWEKSTYLANATNMYKLQRCIRLPWIACGTIQRQTSRHECSGSHYTIWDWSK